MNWIDKWQILNCELLILFGLRLLTFLRLLFCSGLLVDVRLLFYLCFIDLLLGDILFLLVCIRILSLFLLLLRLLLLFLSFLLLFCLFPSFLGENFLKMLIFVKTTVVEVPDVKKLVVLLISLDQSSIFTFFQRGEWGPSYHYRNAAHSATKLNKTYRVIKNWKFNMQRLD